MGKYLYAVLFILCFNRCFSAGGDTLAKPVATSNAYYINSYYISPEFGGEASVGKDQAHVFLFGFKAGLYGGIPVPKTGLNIGPSLAATYFENYSSAAYYERLLMGYAGGRVYYNLKIGKKTALAFGSEFAYAFGNYVWGPRRGYQGNPVKEYTVKGYVVAPGIGINTSNVGVSIQYEVCRVMADLDASDYQFLYNKALQTVPSLYASQLVTFTNPYRMNFDRISLTIKYNIPITK